MDLGISHQTCSQCGAMIVPPGSISKRGEKIHKVEFVYPAKENELPDDAFIAKELHDEIQKGLHDTTSGLVRLKGKSYGQCVSTLRSEYAIEREKTKSKIKDEAIASVNKLKSVAKSVSKTETPDEKIIIEAERHEPIMEGDEHNGVLKCPVCGFVLLKWNRSTSPLRDTWNGVHHKGIDIEKAILDGKAEAHEFVLSRLRRGEDAMHGKE